MNTAQQRPQATAAHDTQAANEPHRAPALGMTTTATMQQTTMATPPTTIPTASWCALDVPSATTVTLRLASATDGADANSPENAFGLTTSPMRANATTSTPAGEAAQR